MRLDDRRAGSCTTFIDSASGESLLEVASTEEGVVLLAFRLYDANGKLAAESKRFRHYPKGLTVNCPEGEQLLYVPSDGSSPLQYTLYNSSGRLVTWSDGARTKIYGQLRMEGTPRGWTLPS